MPIGDYNYLQCKYSKHWPHIVAHIFDCMCSKINNSWFNPWFSFYFSSLYPAPYISYLNFKAALALLKTAPSAQTYKSITFLWIVWSTLYVYLWRQPWDGVLYFWKSIFIHLCFHEMFFFLTSKKKVFKYSKLVKNAGMYNNFSSEMICIRCVAHFCLAHIWSQIGVIKNVVCKTNMILIADALKGRKQLFSHLLCTCNSFCNC